MTLWESAGLFFLAAISLWAVLYPHHRAIQAAQVRPAWEEMGKAYGGSGVFADHGAENRDRGH